MVRVECLGGTLRPLSQGLVGTLAEASLQRVSFDKAFLGVDAVTADLRICEVELDQTRLKEMMIERAGEVYILAHSAKVRGATFPCMGSNPAGSCAGYRFRGRPKQVSLFEGRAFASMSCDDCPYCVATAGAAVP